MRMKYTLRNDFHGTKAAVVLRPTGHKNEYIISERTRQRAEKKLCGISTCTCGNGFGERPSTLVVRARDYERKTYTVEIDTGKG